MIQADLAVRVFRRPSWAPATDLHLMSSGSDLEFVLSVWVLLLYCLRCSKWFCPKFWLGDEDFNDESFLQLMLIFDVDDVAAFWRNIDVVRSITLLSVDFQQVCSPRIIQWTIEPAKSIQFKMYTSFTAYRHFNHSILFVQCQCSKVG